MTTHALLELLSHEGEQAILMLDGQPQATGLVKWYKLPEDSVEKFQPSPWLIIDTQGREASLKIRGNTILLRGFERCHEQPHYHFYI